MLGDATGCGEFAEKAGRPSQVGRSPLVDNVFWEALHLILLSRFRGLKDTAEFTEASRSLPPMD